MSRLITELDLIDSLELQMSLIAPDEQSGDEWERLQDELREANRRRQKLEL